MRFQQLAVFLVCALPGFAQTQINGGRVVVGVWDASGASASKPAKSGAGLPGTCSIGEQYFRTDAVAGQNLYLCAAANTWSQIAGGGSGAASASYVVANSTNSPATSRVATGAENVVVSDSGPGGALAIAFNVHDNSTFYLKDDFPVSEPSNGFGELSWQVGGAGAAWSFDVPAAAHPGIFKCTTTGASGNFCRVFLGSNDLQTLPRLDTNTNWKTTYVVQTGSTLSNATYFAGMGNGTQSNTPFYEIGLLLDASQGSSYNGACNASGSDPAAAGAWMLVVKSGSTVFCRNTGVSGAALTWYQLEISSTTAGVIQAVVNGAAPVSIGAGQATAAVPPAPLGFLAEVWTFDAVPKVLDVDFFSAKIATGRRY